MIETSETNIVSADQIDMSSTTTSCTSVIQLETSVNGFTDNTDHNGKISSVELKTNDQDSCEPQPQACLEHINCKRQRVGELETSIQEQVSLLLQKVAESMQEGGIKITNCLLCQTLMGQHETNTQFNLCAKCFDCVQQ